MTARDDVLPLLIGAELCAVGSGVAYDNGEIHIGEEFTMVMREGLVEGDSKFTSRCTVSEIGEIGIGVDLCG